MKPDSNVDLAGHSYWEDVWELTGEHRVGHLSYFHHALSRVFDRYTTKGTRVCEVGCADSAWIPHLIGRGALVSGIDYSAKGIARLRAALERRGLEAELIVADMLDPAFRPTREYDVAFSLGLIEHFSDPRLILAPMSRLLRTNGVLITLVPNLRGLWGRIQGRLDPEVLAVHLKYAASELDEAHARSGLTVVEPARHFGIFGPLVLNVPAIARRHPRLHRYATGCVWMLEQAIAWPLGVTLGSHAESQLFSSHLIGVYRKSAAGAPRT